MEQLSRGKGISRSARCNTIRCSPSITVVGTTKRGTGTIIRSSPPLAAACAFFSAGPAALFCPKEIIAEQ